MEIIPILSGAYGLMQLLKRLITLLDDYRQLVVTKELTHLLNKIEALRTLLICTAGIFESIPEYPDSESGARQALHFKALHEEIRRRLVEFKHTAKMVNHEVRNICGETGPGVSKDIHGLVKLLRLRNRHGILRLLQHRLSFHTSSIMTIILTMNTCNQQQIQSTLDQILEGHSRLPTDIGPQRIDTPDYVVNNNELFEVPCLASDFYTGRNDHAKALRESFRLSSIENCSAQQPPVIFIQGEKEVGKTYLCSQFAEENKNSYWGVFWINAESEHTMKESCVTIARLAGLEAANRDWGLAEAMTWLSYCQKPWLLIIDNASQLQDLQGKLPRGNKGHILITTRSPEIEFDKFGPSESFRVSPMDTKDAQEFLLSASGFVKPWYTSDLSWAGGLALYLGPGVLPRTLVYAGATIRNGFCDPADYERLSREQSASTDVNYSKSSEQLAFELAIRQIRKQKTQSSQDAFKLLKVLPFFHANHISFDTLVKAIFIRTITRGKQRSGYYNHPDQVNIWNPSWRRVKFAKAASYQSIGLTFDSSRAYWALMELMDMSLIISDRRNDCYTMDPVVKGWIKDSLPPSEYENWKKLADLAAGRDTV